MIVAHNIFHHYHKDVALENINLEIAKGEFVAITGESGSGKTTLLSILSSLLQPSKGEVLFKGTNLKNIANMDDFRQHSIGFVFQFHYLINYLSLEENVKIANENATQEEVDALFKQLDILNLKQRFPNEVSGGQRQRAAIVRALINKPNVLFADEPTGNLDSNNSKQVFELFSKLASEGMSIVVATHDQMLSQKANRIIKVEDGKLS